MDRSVRSIAWAASSLALLLSGVSIARAEGPASAANAPAPDEAKIELGRRFFFDPAASRLGRHACAECHLPDHGFSDPRAKSDDDFGPTERHSQSLVDVGQTASGHWDGQFTDVRDLVLSRLGVGRRVGAYNEGPGAFVAAGASRVGAGASGAGTTVDAAALRERVRELRVVIRNRRMDLDGLATRYREALDAALGKEQVTPETIADAIHAYCGSIRSGDAPFDRFARGDESALSANARRGFLLFTGRAGCVACHRIEGEHPRFTDDAFHDSGVAWKAVLAGAAALPGDRGRMAITNKGTDVRAFKTPSLRDVARRGPYMHDGSLATLEDVVRHYLSGKIDDPSLDEKMPEPVASADDVAALVEFLRALTSDGRPGLAASAWTARAPETTLRFVDAKGVPLAHRSVRLVPAGDAVPGGAAVERTLETDGEGRVAYDAPASTHVKVVFGDGLPIAGGDLVPDTCRSAVLRVPVSGTAKVTVVLPAGATPPATLRAEHASAPTLPIDKKPVTTLRLVGSPIEKDGAVVATYSADVLDKVPPEVEIAVPGATPARVVTAKVASTDAEPIDLR